MKAFLLDRYGKTGNTRIGDAPEPPMGDGDVLVRIHAASVNPLDFKIRDGDAFWHQCAVVAAHVVVVAQWRTQSAHAEAGPRQGSRLAIAAVHQRATCWDAPEKRSRTQGIGDQVVEGCRVVADAYDRSRPGSDSRTLGTCLN